jgi:hypothetical protein
MRLHKLVGDAHLLAGDGSSRNSTSSGSATVRRGDGRDVLVAGQQLALDAGTW